MKKKLITKQDKTKEKPDGITYSESFAAVIKGDDRKKELVVLSPRFYHHQINKFKVGQSVTLMVHSRKAKRTEAQNRYLWGVYYPSIAAETGERDLDRLHELFKGKFLTEGVVEVLGEKVRLKKSSTNLSVSDFCEFIMAIESLTGVAAPPTENYGLTELERSTKGMTIEYPDEYLPPTI